MAKPAAKTGTGKPSKEIVKTPAKAEKQLAVSGAALLEEDAGQQAFGRDDLAIPRIKVLQDLSPEVKKTEVDKYIKGAECGMILDSVSKTLFDGEKGVEIIPVSYRRTHLEWKPNRGGFVADHGPDGSILNECTKGEKGQNVLKNGNIITISAEYFVFLLGADGSYQPFALSLAGTQLKKSRQWNTIISQLQLPKSGGGTFNPAMFARSYNMSTIPERNDQGSWFGVKIVPSTFTTELPNGNEIYIAAREFRAAVAEGKIKAAAPVDTDHAAAGPGESDDAPM